jgi:GntR family transcriptional regulator
VKVSDFTIDFRSGIPAYIQIVEQVQHKLAQGLLKPGEQLPTVRQMAAHLRVNFNTIARAYRVLDNAGLISTQQGRGTYILEQLEENRHQQLKRDALLAQARRFFESLAQQGYQPQEVEECLRDFLHSWKNTLGVPSSKMGMREME